MVLIMEWLKKIASIIGKRFPSPCGDYGSYLLHSLTINHSQKEQVSVPLRGLWFLSHVMLDIICDEVAPFPSPCGDYGSYLPRFVVYSISAERRFRPLAGIMVLITM